MEKYNIRVKTDNCTGCLRCQLACSYLYTKRFNPAEARINVTTSDTAWSIDFTNECNGCGICSNNCFFDALIKTDREVAQ